MQYKLVNLGIIFDQLLITGGGYQQALNIVIAINKSKDKKHYLPKFFTIYAENIPILNSYGIHAEFIKISKFGRAWLKIRSMIYSSFILKCIGPNKFEKCLINKDIDLVYFLSPSGWSNYLEKLNYIITIWDSCHRDAPEFPEVYEGRIFEKREANFNKFLTRAVAVIVDSKLGKENVIRRYMVDESRIHILPFSPAFSTQNIEKTYNYDIKNKFKVPNDYIFYPAQFWAHKNHAYVLQGVKALKDEYNINVSVVFSGGDAGNLNYIKSLTHDLGLSNQVHFLGFVDNEDIINLYKGSIALVMPTYFGPTNIPPLEAFILGTPVLYSDLPGLRDQVGDSALLLDLNEPASMSKHIYNLIKNPELREKLVDSGKRRMNYSNQGAHNEMIGLICSEFQVKMFCWKNRGSE